MLRRRQDEFRQIELRADQALDAREAAALFGVTAGRWRQIAGSRTDPNPELASRIDEGERRTTWSYRELLQFAMRQDRALPESVWLPSLLPLLGNRRRYEPIGGRVWNARDATKLSLPTDYNTTLNVWAQMYIPVHYRLCGREQPPLLVLTALWPTEASLARHFLRSLTVDALTKPGWNSVLGPDIPLTVAAIDPESVSGAVAHEYSPDDVHDLLGEGRDQRHFIAYMSPIFDDIDVPARDLAACLGQPVLPVWPKGTASVTTVPLWRPGVPVRITMPESLRPRSEAAQWLAAQAPLIEGDFPSGDDYLELAGGVMQPRRDELDPREGVNYKTDAYEKAGFEIALSIAPSEPIASRDQANSHPWAALDAVHGQASAPVAIGTTINTWVGDPRFSRPAQWELARLPGQWQELFARARRDTASEGLGPYAPPGSLREYLLEHAHQETSTSALGQATRMHLGGLDAPVLVDAEFVTWLPPTGYVAEGDGEHPGRAIVTDVNDPIYEAVFAVDVKAEERVRGWYRTINGRLAPLLAKSQWGIGTQNDALLLKAAVTAIPFTTLSDARMGQGRPERQGPLEHRLERMIDAAKELPDTSITYEWSDLIAAAHEDFTPVKIN